MTQYIYPQNLKATANLWLWGLRDFVILAVTALLSVLALVQLRIFLPAAAGRGVKKNLKPCAYKHLERVKA